jgi:hypothetical protein
MILVLGVWAFVRALLVNSAAVSLENVALRHQLAVLQRSVGRPRLRRRDRLFWVGLSQLRRARHRLDSTRMPRSRHRAQRTTLRRPLRSYLTYYNTTRPHQSLHYNSPHPREVQTPGDGRIVAIPQVGGLHNRYRRAA